MRLVCQGKHAPQSVNGNRLIVNNLHCNIKGNSMLFTIKAA